MNTYKEGSNKRKIFKHIMSRTESEFMAKSIMEELPDIPTGTISGSLSELCKDGHIVHVGKVGVSFKYSKNADRTPIRGHHSVDVHGEVIRDLKKKVKNLENIVQALTAAIPKSELGKVMIAISKGG